MQTMSHLLTVNTLCMYNLVCTMQLAGSDMIRLGSQHTGTGICETNAYATNHQESCHATHSQSMTDQHVYIAICGGTLTQLYHWSGCGAMDFAVQTWSPWSPATAE